jgi:hypothetical protein
VEVEATVVEEEVEEEEEGIGWAGLLGEVLLTRRQLSKGS